MKRAEGSKQCHGGHTDGCKPIESGSEEERYKAFRAQAVQPKREYLDITENVGFALFTAKIIEAPLTALVRVHSQALIYKFRKQCSCGIGILDLLVGKASSDVVSHIDFKNLALNSDWFAVGRLSKQLDVKDEGIRFAATGSQSRKSRTIPRCTV